MMIRNMKLKIYVFYKSNQEAYMHKFSKDVANIVLSYYPYIYMFMSYDKKEDKTQH